MISQLCGSAVPNMFAEIGEPGYVKVLEERLEGLNR
jgi:hypothetical protein